MRIIELISFILLYHVTRISGRAYKSDFKEVTTADGKILGRRLTTYKNNNFYAFQDIPYAQPPIGPLRLREAIPPTKWEGVLNTTANLKICHQFYGGPVDPRENEDCLVLSVYTPEDQNKDELLPVLVWIHGGSFLGWSGAIDLFGPDYFIDKKIVVVTMNYRLGPLGFLSTDDGVMPENIGLKDQHLALKWVNRSIASFGGDPSKVTLSGQSAGAVSVGYHVLSKKSQGLFRAAILQSGSPLTCWGLQKNAKHVAQNLGKALSSDPMENLSSQEIFQLVQTAGIEKLKEAFSKVEIEQYVHDDYKNCHRMTSTLISVVKEDENDESSFVTGMNHEKLKNGDIFQVPILIGINSQESLLFSIAGEVFEAFLLDLDTNSSIPANMNMKNENKIVAGGEVKSLYSNDSFLFKPSSSVRFISDCMFTTPLARHAFLQSQYTDVYFYQFSYRGTLGRYVYNDFGDAVGVAHQEELGYLWHNASNGDLSQFPKEDILTHERVVELWSQFIEYLNPTVTEAKVLGDIQWPKVSQSTFSYLDIDTKLTIKSNPKKYKEWSDIYSKYAETKLDTY